MSGQFFLLVGLFLLGLAIRAGYEQLKKAGRLPKGSLPVTAVVFVAMFTLWASWFSLCPLDPLPLALPGPLRWLGLALFIGGLGLAVGALIQLRGLEDTTHLVTTGLFAKIRHPMYTGFILWIVGWALYHGAPISLLFGLVGIAGIISWGRREDRELKAQFGEAYRRYRQETWF